MKILAINGTPHRGNTWSWANYFKNEYADQIEFSEIHLYKEKIPYCLGCNLCLVKGEDRCPHSEEVQAIVDKISEADGTIIASSAYSLGVNAVLKNFIDHMSYNFHRPQYPYKKALVITSAAGSGHNAVAKYIHDVLGHWNFNKIYRFAFKSVALSGYKPNDKQKEKFDKVAKKFLADIESKKIHSPSFKRLFYFGVWKAMALTDIDDESEDKKFWTENGMMDLDYHKGVKINPIKKRFARIMYKMMHRIMKRNKKKEL